MQLLRVDKVQHFPFKGTVLLTSCCTLEGNCFAYFSDSLCKGFILKHWLII